MSDYKHIILLSTKSAGSSAFQMYLHHNFGFKFLPFSQHQENETLFWTKAASVLGYPQDPMYRSVVPYAADEAKKKLQELAGNNKIDDSIQWNESGILKLYQSFAIKFGPLFFEKSPHHLFNWSNLELIIKAVDMLKENVECSIVGLVRNPLDTIYSAWSRWKYDPYKFEIEWRTSYNNLIKLKQNYPELISILRYEDISLNNKLIDKLNILHGINKNNETSSFAIHNNSMAKWRNNKKFGFQISAVTIELAKTLGYTQNDLINKQYWTWPFIREYYNTKFLIRKLIKN